MKKRNISIIGLLSLMMILSMTGIATAAYLNLTVYADSYTDEYGIVNNGETITIDYEIISGDWVYVYIMVQDEYLDWDPDFPSIGNFIYESDFSETGENQVVYESSEYDYIYVVFKNDAFFDNAEVRVQFTISSTSGTTTGGIDDDDDDLFDDDDDYIPTSNSGLPPIIYIVAVAAILVVGLVVILVKRARMSDEDRAEEMEEMQQKRIKKGKTPWPEKGLKAKRYAKTMSKQCEGEIFLKEAIESPQPGSPLVLNYKFTNGHNYPVVFKQIGTNFYYHTNLTPDEIRLLREQRIAEINNDSHYDNRYNNQSVMNSYKDEIKKAKTEDPRSFNNSEFTKIPFKGSSLYVKRLGIDKSEVPNIVVQPEETVTFDFTMTTPHAPNNGGRGLDYFVIGLQFIKFIPEGCEWKKIGAKHKKENILPYYNSDRQSTFKIASDFGL